MKHLLTYLKFYKKETVLAPLFKLLEAAFELFVPLVIARIIDYGIASSDKKAILEMVGVLVLLAVIGLSCSLTAQFFAAKAATGVSTRIRKDLFSHIERFSFSQIDTLHTSTLITRMTSDVNQVQSGINMVLRLFLRSPIIVFGAMIMAFTIDVKEALLFVVLIPILGVIVGVITIWSIPMYKKVQGKLDSVLGLTRENLSGARVIRAFGKEETERDEFCEKNRELVGISEKVGRVSAFLNPVTQVIVNLAIIALVYTGAIRVNGGAITQGEVVALWNYMSQILVELIKLANLIVLVTKAIACGDRIEDVLRLQEAEPAVTGESQSTVTSEIEEVKENGTADANAVAFSHVSFTYPCSKEPTLSDISFVAKKGQMIGIIGGTGSGKTTLVNLLMRFYEATQGSISLFDKEIQTLSIPTVRQMVSIVMQKAVLFAGTIRDNLLMGREDANEEECIEALRKAQALSFVEEKGGLDATVLQEGKNFSGGQKQRLCVARALLKKSEILILDDSSSALDFATEASLRKEISKNSAKQTVFVVSQRASSIMHADKILVLEDGRLVGCGTHAQLLKECEVYQEIYYSQYPEEGREKA